jgi:hypothetical protein
VAGEVALDEDRGAGYELGDVRNQEGVEDDAVAVDPLTGEVALGEVKDAKAAVAADRAGEGGQLAR